MRKRERDLIARAIARELFRDMGTGEQAKRLVVESAGRELDGPGYCEAAVVRLISDMLMTLKV